MFRSPVALEGEEMTDSTHELRHSLNEVQVRYMVAMQVRAMRESRGWSQEDLAERASLTVDDVACMENPEGCDFSIKKLRQVSNACDVGLLVRFAPFGMSPAALSPPSFDSDSLG